MFKMSSLIAYIIGVYLGDGYINCKKWVFKLYVTDKDFAEHFQGVVYRAVNRYTKIYERKQNNKNWKNVFCYEFVYKTFCQWIMDVTDNKNKIPEEIINGNEEAIRSFLSGFFDSEGSIMSTGCGSYNARIQNISLWMDQVEDLFHKINIRTSGFRKVKRLGQKEYFTFDVYIKDLYDFPVHIKRKRDRILWHKDNVNPLHSETIRQNSHHLGENMI